MSKLDLLAGPAHRHHAGMRRREFHGSEALGRQLFTELEVMQVAGVGPDGLPVLKKI